MIIKPYGDLPRTYAPDVGEVVEARRTGKDRFVRAVVLHVRRRSADTLEVKVHWLESDLNAGATCHPGQTVSGALTPVIAGTVGWLRDRRLEGAPPLIRQISEGAAGQ